jgi:hypothetical protein
VLREIPHRHRVFSAIFALKLDAALAKDRTSGSRTVGFE